MRDVNNIRIVFYDKESIYVRNNDTRQWAVFHRWLAPKGSYNNGWRQFRHLVLYEKRIDFNHCYRLAFRLDIPSQFVSKAPDLSKFTIEERF